MVLATAGPRRVSRARRTKDDIDWASFDPPGDARHNVARAERIGSVALGAALVGLGIRRRDPAGLVAALFGGYFITRGATGHCVVYQALGVSTGSADAVLAPWSRDDVTGRAATVNARKAVKVERSVTIDRPRARAVRVLARLRESAAVHGASRLGARRLADRSHWAAKAPAGTHGGVGCGDRERGAERDHRVEERRRARCRRTRAR